MGSTEPKATLTIRVEARSGDRVVDVLRQMTRVCNHLCTEHSYSGDVELVVSLRWTTIAATTTRPEGENQFRVGWNENAEALMESASVPLNAAVY